MKYTPHIIESILIVCLLAACQKSSDPQNTIPGSPPMVKPSSTLMMNDGLSTKNEDIPTVNEQQPKIEIKLSKEMISLPIQIIENFSSTFELEQECSKDDKSYLIVDKSLVPYLSEKYRDGQLSLKKGNYHFDGEVKMIVNTPPLPLFNSENFYKTSLNCVGKYFTLFKSGISSINIENVDANVVVIKAEGAGNVTMSGKKIKNLSIFNDGSGEFEITVPIEELIVDNKGSSKVMIHKANNASIVNSGTGKVEVYNQPSIQPQQK